MPVSVLTKRISGHYDIIADNDININTTDSVNITAATMRLNGDLVVTGTTSTVNTANTTIADNILTLNEGELSGPGVGVSLGFAGIEVDRGSEPTVSLRWNESTDQWEITSDGSIFTAIGGSGGQSDLILDTTPQLGGDLDVNGFSITSIGVDDINLSSAGDIILDAAGAVIVKPLALDESDPTPALRSGFNIIYAETGTTPGGTGIFFKSDQANDELVSKSKAIVYSLIF